MWNQQLAGLERTGFVTCGRWKSWFQRNTADGAVGVSSDLCDRCVQSISSSGYRLPWLRFLWFFSASVDEIQETTCTWTMNISPSGSIPALHPWRFCFVLIWRYIPVSSAAETMSWNKNDPEHHLSSMCKVKVKLSRNKLWRLRRGMECWASILTLIFGTTRAA
jgi:hypothetical protein